jgi:hypothetical protein
MSLFAKTRPGRATLQAVTDAAVAGLLTQLVAA